MNNRVFRILVAVVLVCCLVVSWSPIRVQASALEEAVVVTKIIQFKPAADAAGAAGAAVGSQVFSSVLLGLGVVATVATAAYLLDRYIEFSGNLETAIYYYPDGTWSYGVDLSFIESVRAWLFQDGILYLGPYIDASMPSSVVEALGIARANGCHYFYGTTLSGGYPFVAYCNASSCMYLYYIYGSYQLQCGNGGPHTFVYKDETSTWGRSDGIQIKDGKIYKVGEKEPIQTSDDAIELGQVALPAVPLPDGYPEWHTNARPATNPDTDEEITVLPIPFSPSADPETQIGTLTQPDIWQGSIAEPMPDTDTNPDTGTDTDPDGGISGDAPSMDIDDYRLDLTSFFPFCIPFDVARFVNVLAADPVAPRFEFELQLPFSDEPYLIVIDLAPFDSLAALARRLELLGFCIALAVATRNFYIRG